MDMAMDMGSGWEGYVDSIHGVFLLFIFVAFLICLPVAFLSLIMI